MIGPYVNGAALLIGSIAGGLIGPRFSKEFRFYMPTIFGVTSIGVSITMIIKGHLLAPVVLAIILGTILGEIFHLELSIQKIITSAFKLIGKITKTKESVNLKNLIDKFVPLTVLFCFSGMGFYGALQEGMTGDPTLLIIKSILDIFTSLIFASTIGYTLAVLVIPQFIIQTLLYFSATFIIPYTTPEILGDFSACGGIILLAIGVRICGVKNLPVANMVPALLLVLPASWLWSSYLI